MRSSALEERLFEQFKENLSLARETPREGLRSAQAAWRKATPTKRAVWLLVPTVIVVSAVAEHFSVPWYYEAAGMVVLVVGSWMLGAMRRKFQ
jgi:membrane protein YdbS with pleckstrin-like domain